MTYEPKNFERLIGTKGFSDALLKNHFTLYQGYVTNTNKLEAALSVLLREGKTATPEYAELKRRFGWEWNGMRLHELYFENLGGSGAVNAAHALATKMTRDFGSIDAWRTDFRATGTMRGVGWVVLYADPSGDRLFNSWIGEHDVAHLAGCTPLLIMDVFEHAFITDYGLKRADYIDAFFAAINWRVVESRLR